MSKARTLIIVLALVAVLAVAAVAAYVIIQNNRAPEALAPSTPVASESAEAGSTSQPESFDPAALAGEWEVSSDSIAGYRVDEVLGGQDVTVVGRTDRVDGSVTVADSVITAAEIVVNVDSVETDSTNRDAEFRKLLATDTHPDAVFAATEPVTLAAGESTYEVPGTLTVAGATAPVTATITATVTPDGAQLVGNFPIVFEDFGISAPDLGFVTVEDQGLVEFSLNMTKN